MKRKKGDPARGINKNPVSGRRAALSTADNGNYGIGKPAGLQRGEGDI